MRNLALLKDGDKYRGKYVILNNFKERKVVCSSAKLSVALKRAGKEGMDRPVVVFVPKEDIAHIY